jgi:hypothetical protein
MVVWVSEPMSSPLTLFLFYMLKFDTYKVNHSKKKEEEIREAHLKKKRLPFIWNSANFQSWTKLPKRMLSSFVTSSQLLDTWMERVSSCIIFCFRKDGHFWRKSVVHPKSSRPLQGEVGGVWNASRHTQSREHEIIMKSNLLSLSISAEVCVWVCAYGWFETIVGTCLTILCGILIRPASIP